MRDIGGVLTCDRTFIRSTSRLEGIEAIGLQVGIRAETEERHGNDEDAVCPPTTTIDTARI